LAKIYERSLLEANSPASIKDHNFGLKILINFK